MEDELYKADEIRVELEDTLYLSHYIYDTTLALSPIVIRTRFNSSFPSLYFLFSIYHQLPPSFTPSSQPALFRERNSYSHRLNLAGKFARIMTTPALVGFDISMRVASLFPLSSRLLKSLGDVRFSVFVGE